MASPAQTLANRDNAQRSTGPKTQEGKQSASRNAIRHGLTGTQIVIPGEDSAAYEDLRQGLHRSHQPANEAERILVDQIAANSWRLMRAHRVETAFLAKLTEGAKDPDTALAEAFLEKPKELARMHRYVAAAQNAYYKAIAQLSKLQKERAAEEDIGFVSYSDSDQILENEPEFPCTPQAAGSFPQYLILSDTKTADAESPCVSMR
jgi:hypothetical protein